MPAPSWSAVMFSSSYASCASALEMSGTSTSCRMSGLEPPDDSVPHPVMVDTTPALVAPAAASAGVTSGIERALAPDRSSGVARWSSATSLPTAGSTKPGKVATALIWRIWPDDCWLLRVMPATTRMSASPPVTQWFAVSTQLGFRIDPPQNWKPELVVSAICHGCSPMVVLVPPTIS
jgi:hypothetical protein